MKICNNCSAVNQDSAVKCIQCNMPNNFTLQGLTIAARQTEKQTIVCLNCGSDEPGEGEKCVHCRFPLPGSLNAGNPGSYRPVKGRAIGEH